jgi:hypothetical protein
MRERVVSLAMPWAAVATWLDGRAFMLSDDRLRAELD